MAWWVVHADRLCISGWVHEKLSPVWQCVLRMVIWQPCMCAGCKGTLKEVLSLTVPPNGANTHLKR